MEPAEYRPSFLPEPWRKNFPITMIHAQKKEVNYHMKKVLRKILAMAECVLNAVLAAALMLTL